MNESESNQLIIEEGKQGDIHVPTTLCDEIDDAACLGSESNRIESRINDIPHIHAWIRRDLRKNFRLLWQSYCWMKNSKYHDCFHMLEIFDWWDSLFIITPTQKSSTPTFNCTTWHVACGIIVDDSFDSEFFYDTVTTPNHHYLENASKSNENFCICVCVRENTRWN